MHVIDYATKKTQITSLDATLADIANISNGALYLAYSRYWLLLDKIVLSLVSVVERDTYNNYWSFCYNSKLDNKWLE